MKMLVSSISKNSVNKPESFVQNAVACITTGSLIEISGSVNNVVTEPG